CFPAPHRPEMRTTLARIALKTRDYGKTGPEKNSQIREKNWKPSAKPRFYDRQRKCIRFLELPYPII
ncbi:MAG: hypothetical protein ACLFRA_07320, partial [Alphaproteobacteria bacterium]